VPYRSRNDGSARRRIATQERLLEAARYLLVERGYHGVGVREIAESAGVSRQAVYAHHFGSKVELLTALLDHLDRVEGIDDLLRPAFNASSGVEALRLAVAANGEFERRIGDVARVLEAARRSDPDAAQVWADRQARKRAGIESLVDRVADEGRLRAGWSRQVATDFVVALSSTQVVDQLVAERGWSVEAYAEAISQAIEGALVTAAAGDDGR
jgi:AcrR family transcriptional regulator